MTSKEVKDLVQRISETDSRREHGVLVAWLERECNELFTLIDGVCREVGVFPPWWSLISEMDEVHLEFGFRHGDPAVWKAETTCYGSNNVEFFTIHASDGKRGNEIPLELPWFDLGVDGWRRKLVSEKRRELEQNVASAQLKLHMAQDRLRKFNEKSLAQNKAD